MNNEMVIRPYKAKDGVKMLTEQGLAANEEWCAEAEQEGLAFSVIFEGKMILCVGIVKEREGIGQAWALYPPDVGKYHIDPRIAKDRLKELMIEYGFWRVFATVRTDFPAGVKYIEWLGFQREGLMRKNEPDKSDSFLYAITR